MLQKVSECFSTYKKVILRENQRLAEEWNKVNVISIQE